VVCGFGVMPVFGVFVRGLPCSGKSRLVEHFRLVYSLPVIDPDHLYYSKSKQDLSLFCSTQPIDISENTRVYRYNLEKAKELLKNKCHFIWAQPWSLLSGLEYTLDILHEGSLEFNPLIIEVRAPLHILEARLSKRNTTALRKVSLEQFHRQYVSRYEHVHEMFLQKYKHHYIDNLDIQEAKNAFSKILQPIFAQ
jgi:hypothetical protein